MPKPQNVHLSGVMGQSPYFGEYRQVAAHRPARREARFGGGYRVKTTIDLRLQKLARAAIDKWLPSPDGPQAALVALNPATGAVLAMYGWSQLPRESVQPRRAGRAAAGLVVQAVRPRDCAEGGHLPALDVRVEAHLDLPRQQVLVRPQLRGPSISGRSIS